MYDRIKDMDGFFLQSCLTCADDENVLKKTNLSFIQSCKTLCDEESGAIALSIEFKVNLEITFQ